MMIRTHEESMRPMPRLSPGKVVQQRCCWVQMSSEIHQLACHQWLRIATHRGGYSHGLLLREPKYLPITRPSRAQIIKLSTTGTGERLHQKDRLLAFRARKRCSVKLSSLSWYSRAFMMPLRAVATSPGSRDDNWVLLWIFEERKYSGATAFSLVVMASWWWNDADTWREWIYGTDFHAWLSSRTLVSPFEYLLVQRFGWLQKASTKLMELPLSLSHSLSYQHHANADPSLVLMIDPRQISQVSLSPSNQW